MLSFYIPRIGVVERSSDSCSLEAKLTPQHLSVRNLDSELEVESESEIGSNYSGPCEK
jgi:hypothetical protein